MRQSTPVPATDRDWAAVRARLAALLEAVARSVDPSPAEVAEKMRRWTHQHAQRPEAPAPQGERIELVSFRLGAERYALEARFVREVIGLFDIRALPGAPDPFVGILAHRGILLPVAEASRLLGLSVNETEARRVLVLGEEGSELGLLVGPVDAVQWVRERDLREPPGGTSDSQLVHRVTREAVAVIDGDRLLNDPRLAPHLAEGESGAEERNRRTRGE